MVGPADQPTGDGRVASLDQEQPTCRGQADGEVLPREVMRCPRAYCSVTFGIIYAYHVGTTGIAHGYGHARGSLSSSTWGIPSAEFSVSLIDVFHPVRPSASNSAHFCMRSVPLETGTATSGRGPREGCSRWWHRERHALAKCHLWATTVADAQVELRHTNQVFDPPK